MDLLKTYLPGVNCNPISTPLSFRKKKDKVDLDHMERIVVGYAVLSLYTGNEPPALKVPGSS